MRRTLSYRAAPGACLVALLAFAATALPAFSDLDFGDLSSQGLTTKAWDAYGRLAYDDALGYIARCIEMYETQAREMQATLTAFPPTEPPEATAKYWALNDVGTCLFIKGEILLKQGDADGAKEAFGKLAREFKYAQCWDEQGWYWKPAEAAKQKLVELEFDAE